MGEEIRDLGTTKKPPTRLLKAGRLEDVGLATWPREQARSEKWGRSQVRGEAGNVSRVPQPHAHTGRTSFFAERASCGRVEA